MNERHSDASVALLSFFLLLVQLLEVDKFWNIVIHVFIVHYNFFFIHAACIHLLYGFFSLFSLFIIIALINYPSRLIFTRPFWYPFHNSRRRALGSIRQGYFIHVFN